MAKSIFVRILKNWVVTLVSPTLLMVAIAPVVEPEARDLTTLVYVFIMTLGNMALSCLAVVILFVVASKKWFPSLSLQGSLALSFACVFLVAATFFATDILTSQSLAKITVPSVLEVFRKEYQSVVPLIVVAAVVLPLYDRRLQRKSRIS